MALSFIVHLTLAFKENAIQNSFESDITISNINFKYEDENVLKDFSLQVKRSNSSASGTIW
jgi:subfamily B ATP-binding cassette protein MsbA